MKPATERDMLDLLRDPSRAIRGLTEVLVAPHPYVGGKRPLWLRLVRVVEGDAAPFPVRVELPNGAVGQFSVAEIREVRDSDPRAAAMLREFHAEHPECPW